MTSTKEKAFLATMLMIVSVLAVPMAGASTSNGQTGTTGGSLTGALKADISTLDPTKASDDNTWAVLGLIYDSIAYTDPASGAQIPWLAGSWEVPANDPTKVVVHLRQGVLFHDGSTLTADDIVATYNNADLKSNPRFSKGFPNNMSVEKVDALTVNFTFMEKAGRAYAHTFSIPILPGGVYGGTPVGTGTFKYVSGGPGEDTVLTAFEGAFRGRPNIDTLTFKAVQPTGNDTVDCAAGKGMVAGEYDFATWFVSPLDVTCFQDVNVKVSQEYGKEFAFVGYNSATSVVGNPGFRLGVSLATPKQFIVEKVLANAVLMSSSVFAPANANWYVAGLPNHFMLDRNNDGRPDPDEFVDAVATLDDAGYFDVNGDGYRDAPGSVWNSTSGSFDSGGTVTLRVLAPSANASGDPVLFLIGQLIKENTVALGMKATLTPLTVSALVAEVESGNYDIAVLKSSYFGDHFTGVDPAFVYEMLHSQGTNNHFGFSAMDSTLDKMENEIRPDIRKDHARTVAVDVAETLPINVLYYMKSINAYRLWNSAGKAIQGWVESQLTGVWNKVSLSSVHLEGRGQLQASISAPGSVKSGSQTQITVTLTDAKSAIVQGGTVSVAVTSGGGSLDPTSGTTDAGGKFQSTYTAPSVSAPTDVVISVSASAPFADDTSSQVTLTVSPGQTPIPLVTVSASPSSISSEDATQITVKVMAGTTALAGASVSLSASKGLTLASSSGTTDANGEAKFTATGDADTEVNAKVTATVSKPGYLTVTGSTSVKVKPTADTQSTPINVPGFTVLLSLTGMGISALLVAVMVAMNRRRRAR